MSLEADRWQRRIDRERIARREAETLLERKSLELFSANEQLRKQAENLERLVEARTADLGQALARAEAAVRAKADFLATISHEIRTPLNGILGLSELLEIEIEEETHLNHLALLRQSGQILLSLVNELLDFSKIEAGHLEIEQTEFNPGLELEATLHTHLPASRGKGIDLNWQLLNLPSRVVGDSLRLRQVLGNLLSNAIKFTSSGSIRVEASAAPAGGDRLRLKLTVTDTGIGIEPDAMPFLFEPFSQAESSITRRFGGTGLGLAIVRRLTRAMGGDVTVASHPGMGSTFTCEMEFGTAPPRSGGKTGPETDNIPGCDHPAPDYSILLVEDNPINQTVALRFLRKLGRGADAASSGSEALEMAARKSYDIIFMDMQMPEMDGLEATRRLRSMNLSPRPRVIALTANASQSDRERCFAAGMDGFLSKPLRIDDFRELFCGLCIHDMKSGDAGGSMA